MPCRDNQMSLARIDLRRLFTDLRRIDDELEGVGILIFFYQLQVNEPFGACQRFALWESFCRGLKEKCCQLKFAVRSEAIYSVGNLDLREAEVVDQTLFADSATVMVDNL